MVDMLLRHGADMCAINGRGQTPYDGSHTSAIKIFLLQRGYDVDRTNANALERGKSSRTS